MKIKKRMKHQNQSIRAKKRKKEYLLILIELKYSKIDIIVKKKIKKNSQIIMKNLKK